MSTAAGSWPSGGIAAFDRLVRQAEIYHSIIQRKLLDPNDFPDTAALARALNDFERHYNEVAKPFDWNFTRAELTGAHGPPRRPAARPTPPARRLNARLLTAGST
jgi:hypothetical protein